MLFGAAGITTGSLLLRDGASSAGAAPKHVEQTAAASGRDTTEPHGAFWPAGARLVVCVSLQVEAGAPGVRDALAIPDAESGYEDSIRESTEKYTYNEAIPRLLDLFDRHSVKVTSHIFGAVADLHPGLVQDIARRGHEIAAHGQSGNASYKMTADEERAEYTAGIDSLMRACGVRPVGINAAGMRHTPQTLRIFQDLGFTYHVDDVSRDEPFTMTVDAKPLVVIPSPLRNNDYLRYLDGALTADAFLGELNAEFETLYDEAARHRRLMSFSVHDRVSGTPSRVKTLNTFIGRVLKRPGVVFMRKDEIARYVLAQRNA